MAIQFSSGWETGDSSEWGAGSGSTNGTQAVDTTTTAPTGGKYSYKMTATASTQANVFLGGSLINQGLTSYSRFYFKLDSIPASVTVGNALVIFSVTTATANITKVGLTTDGSGNPSFYVYNATSGSNVQVGSPSTYAFSLGTWYLLEIKTVCSATVGIIELRVNGVVAITATGLNTGTNNITSIFCSAGSGVVLGAYTMHFDSVFCQDSGYPGPGVGLLFLIKAGTPTYNTWTKSNASTIDTCWNTVPFNATTNANTATAAGKQTGLLNTLSNDGSGLLSSDIINAAKIAWVGKTSSVTSDGADSSIFRTGGIDTTTASTVYTVSDVYHETALASTPTAAQVLSCEIGLSKGTGTKTHTVEDIWLIVDVTMLRYAVSILRRSHRLKNPPQAQFVKSSMPHLRVRLAQPAAQFDVSPHQFSSRITHAYKNSPQQKLVKSSMAHVRTRLPQPPAAKLGVWPHLLSSRIQHQLKPSSKWRIVKSSFKRWSFIQPPAAKLGVWPQLLSSRIQRRLKLSKSKLRQDEQDVSRRAVGPVAIIARIIQHRRRLLRTRLPAKYRQDEQDVSQRAVAPTALVFMRRLRGKLTKRTKRVSRLEVTAVSGRPIATGLRPFLRRAKAITIVSRRKIRRSRLIATAPVAFRRAVAHLKAQPRKLKSRLRLRTPIKLIQPPAAALGAALREIVHKARPVQLSKPWRIVKSTFKKIWLAQPPTARLGFPPSKLADRHRLVLRPSSKLVKSVMRSPRRQIQPSAAALGMAVRSLIHKAHPVKLGKAWKTVKSSFKLGELQKPAAAALLAFVPTKLRKARRLVLLKSSKLVKDTFHIPRALIQPPAAKLGVALRNIIRKPRPLSFSRPFRLVKMRMRAPRDVIQPPAAKLGVWPHLLSSRIQHRVKPSLRWRIVKSAFKRWSFIQPPAARLGVAVRKLIPKAKLRALPKSWRTVKSLFKRPDKIIPPPIVAGANVFVPKVHSSKLRARAAARSARRRLRLAAPAAFIRLRAIRRIRRTTAQQRPVRRRLRFSEPLAFIRLHAIRRIRQLPARQVRHRLSARIAQAPAALFRLLHMHAARKAQRPTSAKAHQRIFSGPSSFIHFMRTHRRRPTARKPRLSRRRPRIGVLLGVPTVAELLGFLRVRPHGPRALFKPFKWLRVSRWLRQWRFGPPPPPSAELPRIIFNARLDSVVEFAATLNRDPVMTDTSNQMVTIDARL